MKQIVYVLIAHAYPIIAQGIAALLGQEKDLCVCATVHCGQSLLCALSKHSLQVVVADPRLPQAEALSLWSVLPAEHPGTRVVAFADPGAVHYLPNEHLAFFSGIVFTSDSLPALVRAIRLAAEGGCYYSPELGFLLLERLGIRKRKKDKPEAATLLTLKERQVLALICEEYGTKEIAGMLHMEESTVNTHRKRLMAKTGAKNMAGLVRFAVRAGVVVNF